MAFNCRETVIHFVSRRAAVPPQCDRTWRFRPRFPILGASEEF